MMEVSAFSSVLLPALLVSAALSAIRLAEYRHGATSANLPSAEPEADVGHLAMNLGMAAMLGLSLDARLQAILVLVFSVLAAGFGTLIVGGLVIRAQVSSARRFSQAYHLVAALFMTVNVAAMSTAHHDSEMAMASPALSFASTTVGYIFVLDAAMAIFLVVALPKVAVHQVISPQTSTGNSIVQQPTPLRRIARSPLSALRLTAVPHVVMDVSMAAMAFAK